MGSGVAEIAALAGYDVLLHDSSIYILGESLERIARQLAKQILRGKISGDEGIGAMSRVYPQASPAGLATADFVLEAVHEDLVLKKNIVTQIDAIVRSDTILATNTSSISVTTLAGCSRHPERVIGMHFFNPPSIMKLVEVVRAEQSADETVKKTTDIARSLGKTPIICKDTPGFIVNRVARPFYGEALRLLGENVAPVEVIDRIVRLEGGFKMGPFELMDLVGVDVSHAVTRSIYERTFNEPRFRPHPIQKAMVAAGQLGRKSKRGFYNYD